MAKMENSGLCAAIRTAKRPWETLDAAEPAEYVRRATPGWAYMRPDSREEIQMCLHCRKPECTNCLGNGS